MNQNDKEIYTNMQNKANVHINLYVHSQVPSYFLRHPIWQHPSVLQKSSKYSGDFEEVSTVGNLSHQLTNLEE